MLTFGLPIEYEGETRDDATMYRIKDNEQKCYGNTPYSKFFSNVSPSYKSTKTTKFLSDFVNNNVSFSTENTLIKSTKESKDNLPPLSYFFTNPIQNDEATIDWDMLELKDSFTY